MNKYIEVDIIQNYTMFNNILYDNVNFQQMDWKSNAMCDTVHDSWTFIQNNANNQNL